MRLQLSVVVPSGGQGGQAPRPTEVEVEAPNGTTADAARHRPRAPCTSLTEPVPTGPPTLLHRRRRRRGSARVGVAPLLDGAALTLALGPPAADATSPGDLPHPCRDRGHPRAGRRSHARAGPWRAHPGAWLGGGHRGRRPTDLPGPRHPHRDRRRASPSPTRGRRTAPSSTAPRSASARKPRASVGPSASATACWSCAPGSGCPPLLAAHGDGTLDGQPSAAGRRCATPTVDLATDPT